MSEQNAHTLSLAAYKAHFDTLYVPLCLFANKYVHNLNTAKDLVQEVFIKIWEDKIELKNENVIKSYLYTAVRNKSLDFLKSRHHKSSERYSKEEFESIQTETFFLREVVISETSTIIENAVNTLPKKCAQIIKLSLKEYSNKEIAQELSISVNTVKAQKRIAYQKLRPILKESFFLIAYIFSS
ncbi:MAG: RNA polymerase sigma-70 factor [Bacteroidota bacterium]